MRTWILCVDKLRAKIFMVKSPGQSPHLAYTFARPARKKQEFAHYVAEEVELACGAGTDSRLLICGDPSCINQVCGFLSDTVRGSIIGLIPEARADRSSVSLLRRRTSRCVSNWETKHGQVFA